MLDEFKEEYRKLGATIGYFRKLKGLNQEELAEKIDIGRAHMGKIESGSVGVSLDVLFSISKLLEIPVHKFFDYEL